MNQQERTHLIKSLDAKTRFDGRKPDEYREITIEKDIAINSEGSARVRMGKTEVLAGIKMAVEKPYPDTPNQGSIMVGAELLPLSSPEFELGPPDIQAIELARVVDRGIRESGALDFKKLCIKEGEQVWMLAIDICTINDDGNLFDASALAVLAALQGAKFPKFDGVKVDYKEKTKETIALTQKPVSVTVIKVGNHFLVDPTTEEETVADARLTVASLDEKTICAMQKGGEDPVSVEDIETMVSIALAKGAELRKKVEQVWK